MCSLGSSVNCVPAVKNALINVSFLVCALSSFTQTSSDSGYDKGQYC